MAQTDEPLPLSSRSDTIGQLAGLAAPLALGAGALYYPRLASAMKLVKGQHLGRMDFTTRDAAKALLRQAPALRKGAIEFGLDEAPLSLLGHSANPWTPAKAFPDEQFGMHLMDLGLHPPGMKKPIPAAQMDFMTNPGGPTPMIGDAAGMPGGGSAFVNYLGVNPALRLHPAEFHQLQDTIEQFLRSYGVERMGSAPISDSRGRLFKQQPATMRETFQPKPEEPT